MDHLISSLGSQRLGVAPKVAQCMINTLCKMKHYIWTANGDSDWCFGGDRETLPLQGADQGKGAASPIIIAISCVIISYLEHHTTGVQMLLAITLTKFTMTAIMYIDDSDILLSSMIMQSCQEIERNSQQKHTSRVYNRPEALFVPKNVVGTPSLSNG